MLDSSADTIGAFNTGFDTGNLRYPTKTPSLRLSAKSAFCVAGDEQNAELTWPVAAAAVHAPTSASRKMR